MANNAAWAGLGQAIGAGGEAYNQARAAKMNMLMMQQKKALEESEIGKNKATENFLKGKTGGYDKATGEALDLPPVSPDTLPGQPPQIMKPLVDAAGPSAPEPTANAPTPAPTPGPPKNPYGDTFRAPTPGETKNDYAKAHLQFEKDRDAMKKQHDKTVNAPPAGAGGRSATSLLNWASKQGLNRIDSAVNAYNRLTTAYNAGHSGDDNNLKQVASGFSARHPVLNQILQSKANQPLTDNDRAAIYNGIRAAVADETNRLRLQCSRNGAIIRVWRIRSFQM